MKSVWGRGGDCVLGTGRGGTGKRCVGVGLYGLIWLLGEAASGWNEVEFGLTEGGIDLLV